MIGQLKGIIIAKQPPEVLIDVNGVGYELRTSMNTFYKLPEVGQEISIHTHLVVREDVHELYGFCDLAERTLFRTLIKVSNVGPKMAMSILSSIDPETFVLCIENEDETRLTRISGIGKKTAERLIIEMRDRLKDWNTGKVHLPTEKTDIKIAPHNQVVQDAISALITLGYKPQEASRAVTKVAKEGMLSEEIIRLVLKNM